MLSSNETEVVPFISRDNSGFEYENPDIVHAAMGILVFFSVAGIVGNAMVLYVFTRQKQMLTSTIFILTLAATDFVSSLITMPFTIAIELLKYRVEWDIICKLYHFMVTSTIPFSAFVMVAIALDRYLCIVHPFKHTMTLPRAKIIVVMLAVFAICIGLFCCIVYGVYHDIYGEVSISLTGIRTEETGTLLNTTETLQSSRTVSDTVHTTMRIVYTGICARNTILISDFTFKGFQKFYSSLFGVCALIVIVLYISIYQKVARRRRRQRLKVLGNRCCAFKTPSSTAEHEETEFTTFHNENNKDVQNGGEDSPVKQEDSVRIKKASTVTQRSIETDADPDMDAPLFLSGVSQAKLEKLRIANIKTALMLSIVALVFISAFLPAWLMALKVVPMVVVIFYMYFLYNVANPVIYAFMNPNFRNQLKALFKRCR